MGESYDRIVEDLSRITESAKGGFRFISMILAPKQFYLLKTILEKHGRF